MAESKRQFRVFYRDYANDVAISSAQPELLDDARIAPLADRLLVDQDNFLGVVDRNDLVLQACLDDAADVVMLELLYPESAGAMRLKLSRDDALALLSALPATFDESLLPGAQYISH